MLPNLDNRSNMLKATLEGYGRHIWDLDWEGGQLRRIFRVSELSYHSLRSSNEAIAIQHRNMDLHCDCCRHQTGMSIILQKYLSIESKNPPLCEWRYNCSCGSLHHHAFHSSIPVRPGGSFLGYVSERVLYPNPFRILLFWLRQHL